MRKLCLDNIKKGINIRVVVNDDELTRKNGIKIENTEIEYYKISPKNGNYANLMHHKFCIIDLKKLLQDLLIGL